jgi:PAS domain S-box-containing protein
MAEEALKKNEQHFRDLVESSPTGISIVREGKVMYRNQEQQRIFGPLPETYRPLISDIIHPEDAEKLQKMYRDVISEKILNSGMDIRFFPSGIKKDDHNIKWLHCRASLIEYQGEKAVLLNMMDITKAREMDRLLTIQDRMTSLGHVAAGIAHEIRNPLSGINIYLNTLEKIFLRGTDFENVQKIITKIQSASNKIESVIKRVMDFSKPSEPKFVLTDINKPIHDAIGLSSVTLRKTGISVDSSLSPGFPLCYADPQLIEQVLLNLITNASEAMKDMDEKKKIVISSSIRKQTIVITVSDSGPGVSSSQKQKIFDPFYTTKTGSTGIGLNLSHRIISDHRGSLKVSKSSLGGAKFTIELPLEKTDREKR